MKVPIVQFSHTFTYTILFLWTPHMKYDMSSQKSTQNLKNAKKCGNKYEQTFSSEIVPPRAQISSGSGSAFWAKFGFGFHQVFKFQQSSGLGLSGLTFEVRVFGFIGFRPNTSN